MDRLLSLLALPLAPAWLAASLAHPRWRRDLRERLGLEVPPVQPGALWLHAASVGELAGAEALLPHLRPPVLLTSDTDTGARSARELCLGRPGFAAGRKPADHLLALAPWWAEARPRAVVFLERTWWPVLAGRARRAGVPVIRAAAAEGPRTARLRRVLPGWGWADHVLARDEEARRSLGGTVVGDPKADRPAGPPLLRWPGPFAVGASLRPGEARPFLELVDALGLGALVAPRHPDRFDTAELGNRRWVRRSALPEGEVPAEAGVVLLDTLGELHRCLAGARLVFVGGTLDPSIGGHSPWDAARHGIPVVAGPHVQAQGEAFERVGASVASDGDLLGAALRAGPSRPPPRVAGPLAARLESLAGPPAPESSPRPWAAPLAPLAAAGVPIRRWVSRPERLPVPVISVGSTNARGPGRTSTVRALVALLQADGHRVGVATRGYRRSRPGRDLRDSGSSRSAADLGDEGALLAEAGAWVAAGPDRRAGARRLAELGATVILLDDGLQTFTLRKDLEIAVLDARFPLARGLFPAGERRELRPVPRRAELVLVHHADGRFQAAGERAERVPGAWRPARPEGPVAAVAGIARGADFLACLDVPVARFRLLRDHETPDPEDLLRWAGGLPLVCTAKDRVRLPPLPGLAWRELEVRLPASAVARIRSVAGRRGGDDPARRG